MSPRSSLRGGLAAGLAVAAAAGIGFGGAALPVDTGSPSTARVTAPAGPTSTVCTTTTSTRTSTGSSGGGPATNGSQVYAAAARLGPGATGSLTGRLLGSADTGRPVLAVTSAGTGDSLDRPDRPVVLTADGGLAAGSAGMVYGRATDGQDRGLSLAPCTPPVVDQWLTGLGATSARNSELVLTNPDDREAQVDLAFSGPDGPLSVPGATGLGVPAGGSRTLDLEQLLGDVDGEISVEIKAGSGRVAAVARDLRTAADHTPIGADWHPPSLAPTRRQVIPAVPGGRGTRELVISNPGKRRADVRIEILGPDGPFAPAGAAQTAVDAGAATTVDLSRGLSRQTAAVRVTSSRPVVTAVRAETSGPRRTADLAVQTSQPEIGRLGIAPVGVVDGAHSQVAVSNAGSSIATAEITLTGLDGVTLHHESIPVAPGGTVERRLTRSGPAYLTVRSAAGTRLYGGITLWQQGGAAPGLASAGLVVPAVTDRPRIPVPDPHVAQ